MTNCDGFSIIEAQNPWENFGGDFAVDKFKSRHHRYPESNGSECFLPYRDISWNPDAGKVPAKRQRSVSNRRAKIPCKRIRRNALKSTRGSNALDVIVETDSLSSAPEDILKSTSNTGSEEELERSREPVLLKLAKSDCHVDRIEERKSIQIREDLSKNPPMDRSVWSVVSQATSNLKRAEKTPQTTKVSTECIDRVIKSLPAVVPLNTMKSESYTRKQAIYNAVMPNHMKTEITRISDDPSDNPSAIAESVTNERSIANPPMHAMRGNDYGTATKCSQVKDGGRSLRGTRVTPHNRGNTRSVRQTYNPVNEVIEYSGCGISPNNDDRDVEIDPYIGTYASPAPGISEKQTKVAAESSQLRNGFYKLHNNTSTSHVYASGKSQDYRYFPEQDKFRNHFQSWECQIPIPPTTDESIITSEQPSNEAHWNTMPGWETSSFPLSACPVPNNFRNPDTFTAGRRNKIDSLHGKRIVHRTNAAVVRPYPTQFIDASGAVVGDQSCLTRGTSRVNRQRLNNPDLRDWMREARRRQQALRHERPSRNHSSLRLSTAVIDLTEDVTNPSGEIISEDLSEAHNDAVECFPVSAPSTNILPYYDPLAVYNPPFAVVRRPFDPVVDGADVQMQPTMRNIYDRLRNRATNCKPTSPAIHSGDTAYRFDDCGGLDQTGHPVDHGVPRFIGLVSSRRAQSIAAAATGAVPLGTPLAACGSSRQSRLRTTVAQQHQGYGSVPLHFSSSLSTPASFRVGNHWAGRSNTYESHASSPVLPDIGVGHLPGPSADIEGYIPVTVQHYHTRGVLDRPVSHQHLMDNNRPLARTDSSSLRGQNVPMFTGPLPSLAYPGRNAIDGQASLSATVGGYTAPNANPSQLSNRLSRSVYQAGGQIVQESQGRVVVVDDIREKSITGRSRKAARSTLRNSNPVFPSTTFGNLLHSNFQQPSSSQNPPIGPSFYAPNMRKSNPLVNNRASSSAVAQGLVTGPVVADRYLNDDAFGAHDPPGGHLFQQPGIFPSHARVSERPVEGSPPLNAPTLVPSASPANIHRPGNYSPISMDSFLDSLDCASHEVEEPMDDAYQSLGSITASRTTSFTGSSSVDVPDGTATFANPSNRYLVIRPGLTKRKQQQQPLGLPNTPSTQKPT